MTNLEVKSMSFTTVIFQSWIHCLH